MRQATVVRQTDVSRSRATPTILDRTILSTGFVRSTCSLASVALYCRTAQWCVCTLCTHQPNHPPKPPRDTTSQTAGRFQALAFTCPSHPRSFCRHPRPLECIVRASPEFLPVHAFCPIKAHITVVHLCKYVTLELYFSLCPPWLLFSSHCTKARGVVARAHSHGVLASSRVSTAFSLKIETRLEYYTLSTFTVNLLVCPLLDSRCILHGLINKAGTHTHHTHQMHMAVWKMHNVYDITEQSQDNSLSSITTSRLSLVLPAPHPPPPLTLYSWLSIYCQGILYCLPSGS